MKAELAPLIGNFRPREVNEVALYELSDAVVAIAGIGAKHGYRAAEVAVAQYRPERLVAAGIAGAISPALRVGDVGCAREVIDAETGTRYATSSGGQWVLVTSARIGDVADKKSLLAEYGADVVDMEGAAVAQVAKQHGLEFAAIKSISDEAAFAMPPLQRFIRDDGQFAIARLALKAILHPEWWAALARLRSNSAVASRNLCAAVEHLLRSGQWPLASG